MRAYDEQLYRVSAETMESLALMFLVPEEDAIIFGVMPDRVARVDFTGPFDGSLTITFSDELMSELAGNMLGTIDVNEIAPEQQDDALKELLNVICGNLLPQIAGNEAVFKVCSPRILTDGGEDNAHEEIGDARLFLENGVVEVTFAVADPSALTSAAV
jgi:CheY-specific phosphatase CheX